MVFEEIIPQALSLMTDVFGNYVIQKVSYFVTLFHLPLFIVNVMCTCMFVFSVCTHLCSVLL